MQVIELPTQLLSFRRFYSQPTHGPNAFFPCHLHLFPGARGISRTGTAELESRGVSLFALTAGVRCPGDARKASPSGKGARFFGWWVQMVSARPHYLARSAFPLHSIRMGQSNVFLYFTWGLRMTFFQCRGICCLFHVVRGKKTLDVIVRGNFFFL